MTPNTPNMAADGGTTNTVFSLLSHPLRRRLLMQIAAPPSHPPREVQLAEFLDSHDLPRQSLIELHHTHLPKLDAADFIDWDRATHTVTAGSNFGDIQPLLELLADNEDVLPFTFP